MGNPRPPEAPGSDGATQGISYRPLSSDPGPTHHGDVVQAKQAAGDVWCKILRVLNPRAVAHRHRVHRDAALLPDEEEWREIDIVRRAGRTRADDLCRLTAHGGPKPPVVLAVEAEPLLARGGANKEGRRRVERGGIGCRQRCIRRGLIVVWARGGLVLLGELNARVQIVKLDENIVVQNELLAGTEMTLLESREHGGNGQG